MKIECGLEKLKDAIVKAERVTGKNLTLPVLSSILLIANNKSLKIRATNLSIGLEIEIPAKVEKEGVVLVDGGVLTNYLTNNTLNQNTTLELVNDVLIITTKNNKATLKTFPYEDFPTIPIVAGEQFTLSAKKLIEGIKTVYYSAALSDIKQEISSVYVYTEGEELVFVATDSFRLAEKKLKIKSIYNFPNLIIPLKNIVEIMKIIEPVTDDIVVITTKNQLSMRFNDTYITSRVIDGTFPDYRQIIPKEVTTEAVVLKQDLLTALKVSTIFSDKFNQITMTVDPKAKKFLLESKNTDIGEQSTVLSGAISGELVSVNFNHKYLIDCLQSIQEDSITISFNTAAKPVIVRGVGNTNFMYLVMPMNR